jgi:hypothetical protein
MRDPNGFYVYVLFRESGTPFYAGKGRGARWTTHEKKAVKGRSHKDNIIARILSAGWPSVPKVKIAENLTNGRAAELEVIFIKAIGREPEGPLVNHTAGGDGCVEPSAEVRKKMGAKNIGRRVTVETRAKMSAARRGKRLPLESIIRGGLARRGQKRSLETRAKMRAAKSGKHLTEEHKAKIGAAQGHNQKYVITDAVKAKMRAAKIGKKLSEEHKKHIGLSLKGRSIPLEQRLKISRALTGIKRSAETKALISESNRRRKKTS